MRVRCDCMSNCEAVVGHSMYFMYHILLIFFFFNDTATTEIYTLSLHDALPISAALADPELIAPPPPPVGSLGWVLPRLSARSEEHTSELQSLAYLVCRLLLEKKKNRN